MSGDFDKGICRADQREYASGATEDGTVRAVFRVMLSGIFLVAGANHLVRPDMIAGRLESAPLGWLATWAAAPEVLVFLAGLTLLVGGVGLVAGLGTRWAALGLLVVVIPITLTVQVGRIATLGPLFKNVGLMGGLVYFAARGAGQFSIDAWMANESRDCDSTRTREY
jgi:putative oxidoreductase